MRKVMVEEEEAEREGGREGEGCWFGEMPKSIFCERNTHLKRATQKQIPATPSRKDIFAFKRKQNRLCMARLKQTVLSFGVIWIRQNQKTKITRIMVYQRN